VGIDQIPLISAGKMSEAGGCMESHIRDSGCLNLRTEVFEQQADHQKTSCMTMMQQALSNQFSVIDVGREVDEIREMLEVGIMESPYCVETGC